MTAVSVGLPVYNAERYLENALTSLVEQTHTDLEIIISDNGSTDRTREICLAFEARDPRIRYICHDRNRGAAFNHNFVLARATKPYFRWYAYDDYLDPKCIELCVAALDAAPPSDVLVWPRTIVVDENSAETGETSTGLWWDNRTPTTRVNSLLGRPLNESLVRLCHPVYGLVRREALLQVRPEGAYPSADVAVLVGLAVVGGWSWVPEAVFYSRRHPASSSIGRTPSEIAAWFDPSRSPARTLLPQTRLFGGLLLAAATPGPSLIERARCVGEVLRWVTQERHWRMIGSEFKAAATR